MTKKGETTLREILSQPEVWADTIKEFQEKTPAIDAFCNQETFDQVIFIGCGSTYYLSLSAAIIFQALNRIPAIALPSSELCLFENIYLDSHKHSLLVAVSRSGETTETIRAMQLFKAGNYGKTVAITTHPESGMVKYADLCLTIESAQEKSIAQTRSFASMLLTAEALSLQISGQNANEVLGGFPKIVRRLFDQYQDLAKEYGENKDINRFFFLGSSFAYGIASEAMLKMKEMSLSNSEAFHTMEFRHGPKSMVDANTLVVGLVNESSAYQEIPVLQEMKALGGKVLTIAEAVDPKLAAIGNVIELKSAVPEVMRALLFLPVLQLIAFYRAIANGQDPDKPHNLDAVVHIPSMI
jgi:glucosamine--fructose-6-phosphate aminotransferase (isomerizing)